MRQKKGKKDQARKKTNKNKPKKLWGLEVGSFSRGARQLMDQDYVDTLKQDEKQWLSDFNETYYGNKFPRRDKRGRKTNMFDKAGIPRKEVFDATNARNRDVHTTNYRINSDTTDVTEDSTNLFDLDREGYEGELCDLIDFNRLVEKYVKEGNSSEKARIMALTELGYTDE